MSAGALTGAVLSRRWRIGHKLGDGGMGEVYAADPVGGGARVAIKILRQEFLEDAAVVARFLDEGRTCMGLIHPNIIRVFECGEAEDRSPFIVMELLEGVPLSAYTASGGRVPIAQAIPILHGILGGLAAAHAKGVIHRDLKPDNVFLTRDPGGTFAAKVLDFGLAKVIEAAGGVTHKTRSGMLLGTPAYMSPEQIKNARDVDPRADLFSAGVLFYEMVTGRAAFPAPTEFAKMTAAPGLAQQPLSRLPEVAALLAPSLPAPRTFASPQPAAPGSPPAPDVAAGPETRPAPGPGDTLSSANSRALVMPKDPPAVTVAEGPAPGTTLQSQDLPILERASVRRGVAPLVVAGLVVGALLVGFLLGWAVGRG